MEDPRDGLSLFGPVERSKPYGVRYGVVGTETGIAKFQTWANRIHHPTLHSPPTAVRPPFPGFEAVFGIPFAPTPAITAEVPEDELTSVLRIDDSHQRVFKTVDAYASRIIGATMEEEDETDIWFVIVPDDVYKYCRPLSHVEPSLRIDSDHKMSPKQAKATLISPSLWEDDNKFAQFYEYAVDFRNQLKARLLPYKKPIQILRESTVAPEEVESEGKQRRLDAPSTVAWNISTAVFYKAGGRPWKIADIRDGVCYVGLVFKKTQGGKDSRLACCAAQMFLDSGDGVVFKGAVGPWYTPAFGDYHLSRNAARELIGMAVQAYKKERGIAPAELFIHGKARFNNDEWSGFRSAVDSSTNLVGVRIRSTSELKLYRDGAYAILRGLAYIRDERTAYLWTRGFIPRLQTYPGMETPNPLLIDVCCGSAKIETVLGDIMALTKLNYNACMFGDGLPVTLRFADSVGEILTAGPGGSLVPLQFRYYI